MTDAVETVLPNVMDKVVKEVKQVKPKKPVKGGEYFIISLFGSEDIEVTPVDLESKCKELGISKVTMNALLKMPHCNHNGYSIKHVKE